jgi:hypothetical protein
MRTIIEGESLRLSEQVRLDRLKTAAERNRWGQFATPPVLIRVAANELAELLGIKLTKQGALF